MWDASSILRNYEVQTGHVLTREELDSGCLSGKLIDADYDLATSVSVLNNSLPQLTTRSSLKSEKFSKFCGFAASALIPAFPIYDTDFPPISGVLCALLYVILYYHPRTCLNNIATPMQLRHLSPST